MPTTTFDKETALDKHREIMREVQRIRDGINVDLMDYYFDRIPDTEEEEREIRAGVRKYLQLAEERIEHLLSGKLY